MDLWSKQDKISTKITEATMQGKTKKSIDLILIHTSHQTQTHYRNCLAINHNR